MARALLYRNVYRVLRIRTCHEVNAEQAGNRIYVPIHDDGPAKLNKDSFNGVAAPVDDYYDFMGDNFGETTYTLSLFEKRATKSNTAPFFSAEVESVPRSPDVTVRKTNDTAKIQLGHVNVRRDTRVRIRPHEQFRLGSTEIGRPSVRLGLLQTDAATFARINMSLVCLLRYMITLTYYRNETCTSFVCVFLHCSVRGFRSFRTDVLARLELARGNGRIAERAVIFQTMFDRVGVSMYSWTTYVETPERHGHEATLTNLQ